MFSQFPRLRQLLLPSTAQPNDPAILMGPDLPPCMQARYVSAWFFRPAGTITNTIDRPMKYVGLVNNPVAVQVDEGFALWDQKTPATICGFYAYKTSIAPLNPSGSGNSVPQEFFADIAQGGTATMTNGGATNFGSIFGGAGTKPWAVNIGGGFSPSLAPFTIDGFDAPRGPRDQVSSAADTAAIAGEAVVLTGNSITWRAGRAYKVEWDQFTAVSVVNNTVDMFVRRNNLAGSLLYRSRYQSGSLNGMSQYGWAYIRNNTGGDITDNLVLTMSTVAGTATGRGTIEPRYLLASDCGAAATFPFAAQI